jgi:hypothetical protein
VSIRTKTLLGTCAALLLGFAPAVAQDKAAPAPMPPPKGAPAAAPAQGQWAQPYHGQHYGHNGCCNTGCCDQGGGCYAGAEVVYIWPNSDQHRAFLITTDDGVNAVASEMRNFDVSAEVTPRLWIGWKDCDGMGIRLRYWRFETELDESETILAGSGTRLTRAIDEADFRFFADVDFTTEGDTLAARHDLRIYTIDIEVTKDFEVCGGEVTLGAGVRYANTESELEAGQIDPTGVLVDGMRVKHKFDGFGPTVSLEGRMPIGGFTAVVGLRTSIILTLADLEVTAEGTDFGGTPVTYTHSTDDGLFISEIFVGAEKCCETCHGRLSFRAGFEAQYWANVGLASRLDDNFSHGSSMWMDGFSVGILLQK